MITLDIIRKPVAADLEEFDAFVARQFTAEGDLLEEMLRYALSSRGKGIRPTLVMLSAAMNAPVKTERLGPRVSLAAMLVEMIHVASLIHDDVIDESAERRGRASVNARWQSRKAVLLGDYILARNMNIGLSSGQFDLVTHVCNSITALCEGEIFQSDCAEKQNTTRQSYLEIIHKKTASLLGTSASVGALAVRAPRERVELMRSFGEALGMAFQIQDDILDFSPSARTGKPSNNDLREGKITLPLLDVLERVDARCHEDEESVALLQRTVAEEGGLEAAARVMQGYLRRALDLLSTYEDSPARTALANLCAYVAERDR